MMFTAALRRFTFTTHVMSSVGWLGAVLVFLALALIGLISEDETTVRGVYLTMAPAAWFVLVPLAHASLISGVALSLGTAWGLFRHYWVATKLLITLFSTIILMIYMATFRQMAGVAADPVVELGLVRNPSPLVHALLALVLLAAATVLAIYKPFGLTPYGARTQSQLRPPLLRVGESAPSTRWTSASGLLAAAIVLLLVLLHLAGTVLQH